MPDGGLTCIHIVYTIPQPFEWDPAKREANLRKHGIDFSGAVRIFDDRVVEREDRRRDYGELRVVALGEVEGILLAVVYTPRGSVFRIISARKAHRHEKAAYRQVQSPEAQGPHGQGAGSQPD
ncbi:MAG: BrnT family toxin [Gemmatimonadales bacterium]